MRKPAVWKPAGFGLALVLHLAAATAVCQGPNGKIVDRAPVRFDEAQLRNLGADAVAVRERLARIDVERITYLSGGYKVKGYLIAPKRGEKLPCLIYNRGGIGDFAALTDLEAVLDLGTIASHGYVVVASQYRGNVGGEGKEEFGGADLEDVLSLFPLLESLPRADATRIGMYGRSRGGLMTYRALTRTDRVRAAIAVGGIADSFDVIAQRPEIERFYAERVPRWSEEREAALVARSAVRWPEKMSRKTPVLLLHGTADLGVPATQAMRLAESFLKLGHPFRLVLFEGGSHVLTEHLAERDRLVLDWLDTYVRDGKRWPSLEPR
jgi:dipeptidyl aminopeptidase/acylaminoacyl peptidase